jgi:Flp pilus assembly pilin Flp
MNTHPTKAKPSFRRLVRDQRGATMVEYAILLFVILVAAAAVYRQVGKGVRKAGDMTLQQFV